MKGYVKTFYEPVEYQPMKDLQDRTTTYVRRGGLPVLFILAGGHEPVVTKGQDFKSGDQHRDYPDARLKELGLEVVKTDRFGSITAHNEQQFIVYFHISIDETDRFPIFRGSKVSKRLRRHKRFLEQTVISAVQRAYGIDGYRKSRESGGYEEGVFYDGAKLAAVGFGVELRRRPLVTKHGLALNMNNDLTIFDYIPPCGNPNGKVTSVKEILSHDVDAHEFTENYVDVLSELSGIDFERAPSELSLERRVQASA